MSKPKRPKIPNMPELPPGYELDYCEGSDDPKYNGWEITIRGNHYDGRHPDEETPKDRAAAVEECWSMWLSHDCNDEWEAFVTAVWEAQS